VVNATRLRSHLWVAPLIGALGGVVLASIVLAIDRRNGYDVLSRSLTGGPSGSLVQHGKGVLEMDEVEPASCAARNWRGACTPPNALPDPLQSPPPTYPEHRMTCVLSAGSVG